MATEKEADKKSPIKIIDEELRQTWKTKPKISSLLPLPFTTCNTDKFIESKKIPKLLINPKFDDAVSAEEYRKTEQLLSPIKMDKYKKEEAIKSFNKRNTIFPYDKRKRIPKPIGGHKEEEIKEQPMQTDNGFEHIGSSTLTKSKVRLEDMITLGLITNSRYSGPVKKILHAPTLRIFAVKEIPLASRESRYFLKHWVSTWQYSLNECDSLISIHGTYWTTPEGCASIVTDYMNAGSIEDLIDTVGALPEVVIWEMAGGVIKALQDVHEKAKCSYGQLSPSNILLNHKGQIKLNIGVTSKLGIKEGSSTTLDGAGEYTPNKIKSLKKVGKNTNAKEDLDEADVTEMGNLLFICSLGGTDILDESIEEIYRNTACCLIHYPQKKESSFSLPKYFSDKRYSPNFTDLLCKLTKKNKADRIKFKDISMHPWFTEKPSISSVNNTLLELLQIRCLCKKSVLPMDLLGPSEKQFDRVLDALKNVIPFCQDAEAILKDLQNGDSKIANDLANDLGLAPDYVWRKLEEVFYDITNSISN